MLLMPNKKKIVSIVMAGMKDKKEGPKEGSSNFVQKLGEESGYEGAEVGDEPASEDSYALDSAAGSFLSAVKKDDAKGVAKALKDFFSICEAKEGPEEGEM